MSDKKIYRACINKFVEKGVIHDAGQVIQVEMNEERVRNLINAGYIEEVKKEEPKVEEKAFEAPQKKVITEEDTEKKGATGLAATLKAKKLKK